MLRYSSNLVNHFFTFYPYSHKYCPIWEQYWEKLYTPYKKLLQQSLCTGFYDIFITTIINIQDDNMPYTGQALPVRKWSKLILDVFFNILIPMLTNVQGEDKT